MLKILLVVISFFVSSFVFADTQTKEVGDISHKSETDDGFLCTFSVTKENGLLVEGDGVLQVMAAEDLEYEQTKHPVAISASATLLYGGEKLSDISVWYQKGFIFTDEMIADIGDALVGSCLTEIVFLPQNILARIGYKLPTAVVKK